MRFFRESISSLPKPLFAVPKGTDHRMDYIRGDDLMPGSWQVGDPSMLLDLEGGGV
jgi:hypothetical protein